MLRCFLRSRRRKLALAVFIGAQLYFLYSIYNQLDDLFDLAEEFPTPRYVNKTDDELDAKHYLQALLRGNADVAAVVETPHKMPDIYLGCRLRVDELHVWSNASWLHLNRWYLLSAYEDHRPNSLYPKLTTSVQILSSTYHTVAPDENWFCHLVNANNQTLRVRAYFRLIWQRAWDPRLTFYNPYLVTCGLPNDYDVTVGAYVTLKGKKCPHPGDAFLRIQSAPKAFEESAPLLRSAAALRVGVCVKGLDFFEDNRLELAEWLLLQYAFGADAMTLYVYWIPPKTRQLLDAMAQDLKFKLVDLSVPGNVTNEPKGRHSYIWGNFAQKRRNELIPYNDCFYSYSHTHDYVLLVDVDELVVPLIHLNWSEMLADFTRDFSSNATSLSVRNVFKFPSAGDTPGLLGRRRRSRKVQENGVSGKSFIR